MSNKVLMGGIIGGIAFFILGWLIYGMALDSFMKANTNQYFMRPMEQMTWWAMICSCLASGFLIAVIFGWGNINDAMGGAKAGLIIGLLIGLSYDLGWYAMSTMYNSMTAMLVDVICSAVMVVIESEGQLLPGGWEEAKQPLLKGNFFKSKNPFRQLTGAGFFLLRVEKL